VGDSLAEDVAGARAAGIAPVLVARRGGTPAPWGGTGADVPTIRSLDELPALLRP
jgi:FMN phosphatase YigB (HAD superfamily)